MTVASSRDQGALVRLDLPEHGQLELPLAGVGGRGLAALIDLVFFFGVGLLLTLIVSVLVMGKMMPSDLGWPALAALFGALPVVGPLFFEVAWRGQTPGKRVVKMRVIASDGSPPTPGQLVLRNILRLVDFLPFGYLTGLITLFISTRAQRLGDMVADTLVIREDEAALRELEGDTPLQVPAELHGVPEGILRGAIRLLDPTRAMDPRVRQQRLGEVATLVRSHRPDLSQEDDEQIWARLRSALGVPR